MKTHGHMCAGDAATFNVISELVHRWNQHHPLDERNRAYLHALDHVEAVMRAHIPTERRPPCSHV